jgi:hypothetical protein
MSDKITIEFTLAQIRSLLHGDEGYVVAEAAEGKLEAALIAHEQQQAEAEMQGWHTARFNGYPAVAKGVNMLAVSCVAGGGGLTERQARLMAAAPEYKAAAEAWERCVHDPEADGHDEEEARRLTAEARRKERGE